MSMTNNWKQITPSDYAWEREALEYLRELLPDHDPYRAWSNFEFIAQDGSINEVDLLVLTPKGCFLVEVKSHSGELSGDASTWVQVKRDGRRQSFDNPRLLADRKAKKLASLLQAQPSSRKTSKERIPFISSMVFLSSDNLTTRLEGPARINVCTRNEVLATLTEMHEDWPHRVITRPAATLLSRAMEEAGVNESKRLRRVGQYELTTLLDESDYYQEWLARHLDVGMARKVRIYLSHHRPVEEARRLQKAAELEFRILEGIEHPGILRALDLQQHDHGPALVYEHDPEAFRLDLLLRNNVRRLDTLQSIDLLKQIAEAVKFAHGQRLYHRALSPHNVYVKQMPDGELRCKIANWSTATRIFESDAQQLSVLSHLTYLVREEAGPYVALEAHQGHGDGVQMDVFSLGTIAYHLFTGSKPAENDLELQDKLSHGKGLQVTDALNGASTEMQYLVQYATHPDASSRIDSVEEFLELLEKLEQSLARVEGEMPASPTDAQPEQLLSDGVRVIKRLGKGASSVVFLVDYHGHERVLKLAVTPDHNPRLLQEANTLASMRHQAIIGYHDKIDLDGHVGLILDYADQGTLAQRLRREGAVPLGMLERFGEDLLGALVHLEGHAIFHRDIKPENLGLLKLGGSQLHLVMFDFSLSHAGADNITAGTMAYMDPFIRDLGRRRWDDYAERFAAALTLYEMTAGSLPGWAGDTGLPALIEGQLQIDSTVFDPNVRDRLTAFFFKALTRDVRQRFANAEEMLKEWRLVFINAQPSTLHFREDASGSCPFHEAARNTQIGLLPLSAAALDALTRRGVNTVEDLIGLSRSKVRVWVGVSSQTRAELSDAISTLQERLQTEQQSRKQVQSADEHASIDRLFTIVMPARRADPRREQFLNEYLGRLDGDKPSDSHSVHWPTMISISAHTGLETVEVRSFQEKVIAQWSKNKSITEIRDEITEILADNGGVITALEVAEALLLRRGSLQESPLRERWAQAVARAAVDAELAKHEPRWIIRRTGRRLVLADNIQGRGEELADYAEALGHLADECAEQETLLSPSRTLDKVRSVPAPDISLALSNARLLRLAAAASQKSALSSRAEFYPIGMKAQRALELAQGALLGSKALTVNDVQERVQGRYTMAEPLPGRPQLDELIRGLDMGFDWDGEYEIAGKRRGAYCLPLANFSTSGSRSLTQSHLSNSDEGPGVTQLDIDALEQSIDNALEGARFLALTVRPRQWEQAKAKLCAQYPLINISFDELLLRHLRKLCEGMARPPDWSVVLKADAAGQTSRDWQNLQRLVARVLPTIADEIRQCGKPVLITDPGLIARYELVTTWLKDLRQQLVISTGDGANTHALLLLIAADAQHDGATIDGVTVPRGAGTSEWTRIPSVWLESDTVASVA
ncbi:BREX system serine/threonine kinase PglW [Halomonas titanicae]|uniref:BREX system serine/threonine kinase PglW n=1 Tax=Vreelandella titanicae TaxID=664683 RepID=UPI001F48AF3E|nr:BREX system serine/threonine kinase PglW [Halomonas titanicae]MCE7517129.1 BREX system serine/threonine kinase PglW [Halomonas titanicae]